MIKHAWSIVCRESKIDAQTNNISILDTYESLQFGMNIDDPTYKQGAPLALPFKFEVVNLFYRDKIADYPESQAVIIVTDPQGNQLGEFSAEIRFVEDETRMRSIFKFEDISLSTSGTYTYRVYIRDSKKPEKQKLVAEAPLQISINVNGQEI